MPPKTVLLMRHAEKPTKNEDRNLSEAGAIRAQELVTFIPKEFGAPDVIIAAAESAGSKRCVQTVTPLAESISLTVQADIKDVDYERLAKSLLRDEKFVGKQVLCCWHHGKLPSLARSLGVQGADFLSPWDPNVFNVIFKLEFVLAGEPAITRIVEPF